MGFPRDFQKRVIVARPCGCKMDEPMLAAATPINDPSDEPPPTPARARRGGATVCRLFGLLHRAELCMIAIALVATLVASFLQMALPVLSGWLIGAISSDNGYSDDCKASAAALAHCRRLRLQQVVMMMGACFLVAGVALALGLWLFMLSGERLVARLRCKLFAAYVQQDIAFFDEQKTGDMMNRLASDCTELKPTLTRSLGEGMSNAMQLGVGLTLMVLSSPVLTLITLGAAPIIAVCGVVYGLFVARLSQRYQTALGGASDVAQQALSSIRTVRSFAREEYERHRYDSSVRLAFKLGARRAAALGSFVGVTSTIAQVSLVCVLWYGCNQAIAGDIDLGELTSFLLLAIYTIASLGGLLALFSAVASALGVSRRLFEVLDSAPQLRLSGGTRLPELRGTIVLDAVHFAYPSRPDIAVLSGVCLRIESGEVCVRVCVCVDLISAATAAQSCRVPSVPSVPSGPGPPASRLSPRDPARTDRDDDRVPVPAGPRALWRLRLGQVVRDRAGGAMVRIQRRAHRGRRRATARSRPVVVAAAGGARRAGGARTLA